MKKRFIGFVYIDDELFTHPNRLMGASDSTRNKVVKQLRENVSDLLTKDYINRHKIELKIQEDHTHQVETISY